KRAARGARSPLCPVRPSLHQADYSSTSDSVPHASSPLIMISFHAHTHSYTHTRKGTLTYACTHSYTHTLTTHYLQHPALPFIHAHTYTHTHTCAYTHTHTYMRIHSHTHTHTHTLSLTHTHIHTLSL